MVGHVYRYGSPDAQRYDLGRGKVVARTGGGRCRLFFTLSGCLLHRPRPPLPCSPARRARPSGRTCATARARLWHEPLVWSLRREGWSETGSWGFLLALLVTATLAGAIAAVSWVLVERPALSFKARGVEAVGPMGPTGTVTTQRSEETLDR